jgi:hypothetical protein
VRVERQDDASAFLPDPRDARPRSDDDLAETLGEEFVETATSAEYNAEDVRDQFVPEEMGGPFVVERADRELAKEPDESNPPDATREPFPIANRTAHGRRVRQR